MLMRFGLLAGDDARRTNLDHRRTLHGTAPAYSSPRESRSGRHDKAGVVSIVCVQEWSRPDGRVCQGKEYDVNILDSLINAQGGAAVRELGTQVGLREDQTASALSALVPALAAGFQRNIRQQDGLGALVSALSAGRHREYIESPASLTDPSTVAEGNGILSHVFGSKEVSREVAARASAQTGLSADVMKRLLPIAAAMMMGALARHQAGTAAAPSGTPESGGGIADLIGSALDRNRDGSMIDDVTSAIGRFLGRA